MFRVVREVGRAQEGDECLLEDIFGFVVTESDRAAVQQQQGGLGLVELFTPAVMIWFAHPGLSVLSD